MENDDQSLDDIENNIKFIIESKYPKLYKKKQSLILEVLTFLQSSNKGFLSPEMIKIASKYLDLSEQNILEIASFYTMFNLNEMPEFHVQICTTPSCFFIGAKELASSARECLDKTKYKVTEVECLGACTKGPVVQVNQKTFYNVKNIRDIAL